MHDVFVTNVKVSQTEENLKNIEEQTPDTQHVEVTVGSRDLGQINFALGKHSPASIDVGNREFLTRFSTHLRRSALSL